MIYDLSKHGLETVFYPYQVETVKLLMNNPSRGYTTAEVHQLVLKAIAPENISRASIINFLADMADWGWLVYVLESCKGGSRRRYRSAHLSLQEFRWALGMLFIDHINKELMLSEV